jgi:imidazolonepropionase-like amidohydrolase
MVNHRIRRCFLFFIGVSLFAASLAKAESGYTVVTNITVIPINVDGSVPHQTVLVRDGRIVTIGPVASVQVPNGARGILTS